MAARNASHSQIQKQSCWPAGVAAGTSKGHRGVRTPAGGSLGKGVVSGQEMSELDDGSADATVERGSADAGSADRLGFAHVTADCDPAPLGCDPVVWPGMLCDAPIAAVASATTTRMVRAVTADFPPLVEPERRLDRRYPHDQSRRYRPSSLALPSTSTRRSAAPGWRGLRPIPPTPAASSGAAVRRGDACHEGSGPHGPAV